MPNESSKQLRQRALVNTPFRHGPTLLVYRSGSAWVSDGDKGFIRSDCETISKFDYQYDVLDQITKWTQQAGTAAAQSYTFALTVFGRLSVANQARNAAP
ncbi:MAG TPA: hypothetical protein VIL70_01215 [Chthoniobacterales bacterium]